MIEFIKTKKNYIIVLAVLFVFISLSDTTYSLFLKSNVTDEFNYNTGLLDLKFTEDKKMILENAFPTIDSDGAKQIPYKLTVKNTGTLPYLFDLKMISEGEGEHIDYKYIKVKVNNNRSQTLSENDNVIMPNIFLYPNEELTLNIKIWLDYNTPNKELGKSFSAKIVSIGSATYKTIDNSGANHPVLNDDMFPVYYNEEDKLWHIADNSNRDINHGWYNYSDKKWANSVTLKNSQKHIYDITRNNDLEVQDIKTNNGNIIIDNKYLDIGLSNYNYDTISNIFRIKFDDVSNDKIYIISNGNISYYYDNNTHTFIFKDGNNTVISDTFLIEKNKWYIIGYTFDGNILSFYINGNKIGSSKITGKISKGSSFKLGTDNSFNEISKITVGDLLIYYRVLKENEINSNYKMSINILEDGLISGYNNFSTMTLKEYYSSLPSGSKVIAKDINAFYVWIPRYKYKVWNVTGENDIDSYDAYNKGIDITFETGTNSSGTITCNENECFGDTLALTKITKDDNNKYYTHPAFSNTTKELLGFWVSKYEVSTNTNTCNDKITTGCSSKELPIESKNGNSAWRNNYLSNYYQATLKLNDERDYHIIKNIEWGAISYLSHSKYGVCDNNSCKEIEFNKSYISGSNPNDSTTLNIYGVYDMAGSAIEYTMGNYADNNNDINLNNTLFKDTPISNEDYDLYTKDSFILGDATKELLRENGIWYGNTMNGVNEVNNWIIRGGNASNNYKGIYAYGATNDITSEYISTRIVSR